MTITLTLKDASRQDLAVIVGIMDSAFSSEYGEGWNFNQCEATLTMPGMRLQIAAVNDKPAGFSWTRSVGAETELLLIAVAPPYIGQGIGGQLLDEALSHAIKAQMEFFYLEVRENNDARHLYFSRGFTTAGRRPGYYRGKNNQTFDALTLKKHLA